MLATSRRQVLLLSSAPWNLRTYGYWIFLFADRLDIASFHTFFVFLPVCTVETYSYISLSYRTLEGLSSGWWSLFIIPFMRTNIVGQEMEYSSRTCRRILKKRCAHPLGKKILVHWVIKKHAIIKVEPVVQQSSPLMSYIPCDLSSSGIGRAECRKDIRWGRPVLRPGLGGLSLRSSSK